MLRHCHALFALPVCVLAGCGGGSVPASAPEAPPPAQSYPQQQPGYGTPSNAPTSGEEYAQPPPAATPPPSDALGPSDQGAQPSVERASLELDRAAAELSAAGSDCPRACKALASMNRASERICALEPDESPGGRCKRAKERVTEATERVRRSCACS